MGYVVLTRMNPSRIPDLVMDKYKSTYSDQLKKMTDRLEEEVLIQNALKGFGGTVVSGGSGVARSEVSGTNPPRTQATPEWNGEYPWNHRKSMPHSGISVADFESANSLLGHLLKSHHTLYDLSGCNQNDAFLFVI